MKHKKVAVLVLVIAAAGILGSIGLYGSGPAPNVAHAQTPCPEGSTRDSNGDCIIVIPTNSADDGSNFLTGCNPFDGFNAGRCISFAFASIGELFLSIAGLLLGLAGLLLNEVVVFTVVEMGEVISGTASGGQAIAAIQEGWAVFRDLGNIVLIFVMLAIGIATILGVEGYGVRRLLPKLIVVALLINFSLFFTQIIVDAGNLLATVAYNQILAIPNVTGISDAYAQAFKLSTFYNAAAGESFAQRLTDSSLSFYNIIFVSVLGTIVFLIAAFALFAAALLLIMRFGVLIILMVLAPLAFVAMILPKTETYAKDWWETLINHTLFAPVFLLLTWFVIKVIDSNTFQAAIGLGDFDAIQGAALANVAQGGGGAVESIGILVNFFIIIVLLVASIVIARKLSIRGAETVNKWGAGLRKWGQGTVGRNTVGRFFAGAQGAYDWSQTTRTGRNMRRAVSAGTLGLVSDRSIRGTLKAGAGAKFGSQTGYSDIQKDERENTERMMKKYSGTPSTQARYLTGLSGSRQAHAYSKLSARDRAAVEEHLDPTTKKRLRTRLTVEEREKTGKAADDSARARKSKSARDALDEYARTGTLTSINPRTGTPFTLDEAATELKTSETRKISHDARMNHAVIQHLSPVQLADILNNGDMTEQERRSIVIAVYDPAHPDGALQARQEQYMEGDLVRRLWGV